MGSIIDKYWNGYKVTYMGEESLRFHKQIIEPTIPFVIVAETMADMLNDIPEDERDNLIYEKVIISSRIIGDIAIDDKYN